MEIGPFIKLNRIKQNMTQEQLAEGIVSESYLSKIENQRTVASPDVIQMLSVRLGIELNKDNDMEIKETAQQWFDKLSVATAKEELREEYEKIQQQVTQSDTDIQVDFEIHKIRYFLVMDDLDLAFEQIQSLKEISGTFTSVQRYYWLKFCGNYNSIAEDFDLALRYYKLAEEKVSQLDLPEDEVAEIKYTLGVTYSKLGATLEVMDYTNKALEIFQKKYNFRRCAHAHILLGISYRKIKIYDKAIENYNLAHRLAALNEDQALINLTKINLGHLYSTIENSEEAIKVFKEVVTEKNTLSDEELFNAITSLVKEYYLQGNLQQAKEEMEKGLVFMKERETKRKGFCYELHTFDCLLNQNSKEFERFAVGELIPYLQKQNDHANLILYCNMVGEHFESLHKYKRAAEYYKLANAGYKALVSL